MRSSVQSTRSRGSSSMDPVELRRVNFIREFPATIAAGLTIDSGDFDASLDKALEHVDYADIRAQQQARRAAGDTKRLGIGFSTYVEMCGLAPSKILGAIRYGAGGWDAATIRCLPTGTVQALTGTSPHGQGHETSWSQIVADQLGYEFDEIEVLHGDTSVVPLGMDTYGSRSLAVGGVALYYAAEQIIEKAKKIAAHRLGVDEAQVEYVHGRFIGPEDSVTLKEIALSAWTAHDLPDGVEPGLEATYVYDPPNFSWPGGAHVAIVEIDTETGNVELLRYVAVDDVGVGDQSDDRRGPDPRRARAGRRAGALRGGGVRRGRQPDDEQHDDVSRAVGGGVPALGARPGRDAEPDEPARREGRGGDGCDRVARGGDERGRRRARRATASANVDMPATPEQIWRALEEVRSMIPAPFDYEVAESVGHALSLLGDREDAKLLAGGHSLLPVLRLRVARPSLLVDLGRLEELSYVRDAGEQARDRRVDAASRCRDVGGGAGAQPARVVCGGADRRSAGAPSRHDRRLARARRSGVRPAGGAARARTARSTSPGAAACARLPRRSSSAACSRRRSGRGRW